MNKKDQMLSIVQDTMDRFPEQKHLVYAFDSIEDYLESIKKIEEEGVFTGRIFVYTFADLGEAVHEVILSHSQTLLVPLWKENGELDLPELKEFAKLLGQ